MSQSSRSSSSRRQRRRSGGRAQQQRRSTRRTERHQSRRPGVAAPQRVDYSQDYAFVQHDLKRIVLWSSLLLVGMIAGYFFIPI